MHMNPALVLDGHLKSALCCVRALGRHGVSITCGAERRTGMACHSRYVKESFVYASPKENQEQFISDVIVQAQKLFTEYGEKPVAYCFSDATSLSLSRAYQKLSLYMLLPLPALESVEQAADKKATYELAEKLGVPTIQTYEEGAFDSVSYPAVVKNRHSIVWKDGKAVSGSAHFVFSRDELGEVFAGIAQETGENPLVQDLIFGEEYGVEMMCEKGEARGVFIHKRIRSLSPRGGAAVVKEAVALDSKTEAMRGYALLLARHLEWHGPLMVEFKTNRKDRAVKLMEINGRFWGSLPLAVRYGLNFPMMYQMLASGDRLEAAEPSAFHKMRTRHFLGDVRWLLSVLFAHDPLRKTMYPSRLRALYDFKKEYFISRGDVFAWTDLKPSFMEYIDILSK